MGMTVVTGKDVALLFFLVLVVVLIVTIKLIPDKTLHNLKLTLST